jgi:hypothetical protein
MESTDVDGRQDDWLRWAMDHIEGQVNFGDAKAGILFTADSILLALLLAAATSETIGLDSLRAGTVALGVISLAALMAALFLALLTILPNRTNLLRPDLAGRGLTNFSAIAATDVEAFLDRLGNASFSEMEEDAARSVHGKATFATRKFKLLYLAIVLTQVAVAIGALAAVVEAVPR